MTNRHHIGELEVERLLLREPNDGRVRAVLETGPSRHPQDGPAVPAIRLRFLTPTGDDALVAEVDADGTAMLFVGHPDHGTTVVITTDAVDLWHGGNVVASLRSNDEGGQLEIAGPDGIATVTLPGNEAPR